MADTLDYTITPFLRGKAHRATATLAAPISEHLRDYTLRVCRQISGILKQAGMRLDATAIVGRLE